MMWARLYNLPSLVLIFMSIVSLSLTDDYRSQRSQFLQNEDAMALGGHLPNKNREQIANNVLMTAKREELAKGLLINNYLLLLIQLVYLQRSQISREVPAFSS